MFTSCGRLFAAGLQSLRAKGPEVGAKDSPRHVGKIQELVYELKVEAVMTRKLITLAPEAPMSGLRSLLRDNRISGVPVVQGESLVGVISVEDFINWLAQGGRDCPVGERMSREVRTLSSGEPLVHAISKLEQLRLRPAAGGGRQAAWSAWSPRATSSRAS